MPRPLLTEIDWKIRCLVGHYHDGNDDDEGRIIAFYGAFLSQGMQGCMQYARIDYCDFVAQGALPPYIVADFERIRNREPIYQPPSNVESFVEESNIHYLLAAE